MTTYPYDKFDKFLLPVSIGSSNRQLVVSDSAPETTISIDTGKYWPHRDNSTAVSSYPGIYREIESKLTNNLSGTYTFETATISGSGLSDFGIKLTCTESFTLYFSDSSWTAPTDLFGFSPNYGTDESGSPVVGSKSYNPAWISPKIAKDQRQDPVSAQFESDGSANAYVNEWKTPDRRDFEYFHVEGAHVFGERARYAAEADRAGLAHGNDQNALKAFWSEAKLLDKIVAVYGDGPSLLVDNAGSKEWEVLTFGTSNERRKFRGAVVEDIDESKGENYKVSWSSEVIESHYLH